VTALALAALGACGVMEIDDAGAGDAELGDASALVCASDDDCADGIFCNGDERCEPGDGARRCAAGVGPCASGEVCDELRARCLGEVCATPDEDGDGLASIACSGLDCDDGDVDRFPGNPERCDAEGHDEDCDPCTVASSSGDGDLDGDGFVSLSCANVITGTLPACDPAATRLDASDPSAPRITGADCADMRADVRPSQVEVCNGRDDNCNGAVDEGALRAFYPDTDHDGYGSSASAAVRACAPPPDHAEDRLDCDDGNPLRHPTLRELCDGVDDDCDGRIDEGEVPRLSYPDDDGDGFGDATRPFLGDRCEVPAGFTVDASDCDDRAAHIHPGAAEICDGLDDDCSSGGGIESAEDADRDGHAPIDAPCTGGPQSRDDCDDVHPAAYPGAPEICDGIDDDCDASADELPDASSSCAPHLSCRAATCTDERGIVTGEVHSCFLRADGTALCWGANSTGTISIGRLGDGTTADRATPAPVVTLSNAVQLAAGGSHTCARLAAGSVMCWGKGMVRGDGATQDSPDALTPVPVFALDDAVEIAAGSENACAIRATGGVVCWGRFILEGGGSPRIYGAPTPVAGAVGAVDLAAGETHACALLVDGTVVCWGSNASNELGDGLYMSRSDARAVPGLADVVEIAAGGRTTCARRSAGTVFCWGRGASGEVPALADAVEIAVGSDDQRFHACARRASGAVVCWGEGSRGELGDGTAVSSSTPVAVLGLDSAVAIACGSFHTCARLATGEVLCWGADDRGQLGDGTPGPDQLVPALVPGLP
jgi:alpha-tubulin suppressor-like RCC1 family protein